MRFNTKSIVFLLYAVVVGGKYCTSIDLNRLNVMKSYLLLFCFCFVLICFFFNFSATAHGTGNVHHQRDSHVAIRDAASAAAQIQGAIYQIIAGTFQKRKEIKFTF